MRAFAWLLVLVLLAPVEAVAREEILSYGSDVVVFADGAMEVTETIRVRAEGDSIRRGIYRDFPTDYTDARGNRYRVGFDVLEVRRDDSVEDYHTESRANGVRVLIGHPDRFLDHGVYTYTLRYRTTRQLGFFDDQDELYWNVTGNDWAFPILEVRASVRLPDGVPSDAIRVEGYTGFAGDKGGDYTAAVDGNGVARFSTTRPFRPREGFTLVVSWPTGFVERPGETERAAYFLRDNAQYLIGVLGLAVLLGFYLVTWHRYGRDPQAGVIFPIYEPPPGYSPASMRYVRRMGYDHKTFATALVNLAVKGLIEIDEEGKKFSVTRTDKPVEDVAPGERALIRSLFLSTRPGARKSVKLEELLQQLPEQSQKLGFAPRLVARMVEQGLKRVSRMQALSKDTSSDDTADSGSRVVFERKNHSRIRAALKAHEASLKNDYDKIYFSTNSKWIVGGAIITLLTVGGAALTLSGERRAIAVFISLWLSFWSIGVAALLRQAFSAWRGARSVLEWVRALFATAFAAPFVIGELVGLGFLFFGGSPAVGVVLVVAVVVNLVFYQLLKAPTRAGRELLDKMDGFRLYLDVAEKDELNLRHPPEKTPELFERYLPFAMAMDVENRWSERFAEVFGQLEEQGKAYRPGWYHGRRFDPGNIGGFSSAMGSSLGSAIASSSTAPGSSSGSGGGGSSGGGGGGGGGGGW